jgi:hypothetical protein
MRRNTENQFSFELIGNQERLQSGKVRPSGKANSNIGCLKSTSPDGLLDQRQMLWMRGASGEFARNEQIANAQAGLVRHQQARAMM